MNGEHCGRFFHYDAAQRLLAIADVDTNTLLRAIAHALLANTSPPLHYWSRAQ
jgi:hypothetical protein